MKIGAQQAVADLNAAGGVLGRQIVLEVGDDACDPRQAVSVANQMAGRKVAMVAGHYCSGSSIPASKVYAEEGVLQISPAATNPKYTDEGSWNTFRVCGRDDQQGQVAGAYIAKHSRARRWRSCMTTGLREGPGGGDQEGAERRRHDGGDVSPPIPRASATTPPWSPA